MAEKKRRARSAKAPRRPAGAPTPAPALPAAGAPQTSEERLRIISELTSDFAYVFAVAPDGTLILEWMAEAFSRITGYQPEELWPHGNWMVLIHPDDLPMVQGRLRMVLSGRSGECDARLVTRQGEVRWARICTRPEWDATQGRVVRVYGAVRDITDYKQTEKALSRSEELYRTLAESAQDAIFIVDREGRLEYVNLAAARVLGSTPEEVVGKFPEELFAADSFTRQRRNLQVVFDSGQPVVILGDTRVGERQIWQETSLIPLRNGTGSVRAIMGISRDVTERKQAEEALQATQQQLAAILDTMSEIVVYMTPDQRIVWANRAAAESLDRQPADLVGRLCYEFWGLGTAPCPWCPIQQAIETGHTHEVETTRMDGRTWYVRGYPVYGSDGKIAGIVDMAQDVTARKRAEEALRASEYQYRTTIDSMRDPIHVVGPDLRFILYNKAMQQWIDELHLRPDVIGSTVFDIFPFLPGQVREEYQTVFRTGEILITEESTRVGGREFITETRKIPVLEDGRVVRIVTVIHDITKRKQAEAALRESEARYRALIETSPDGITLTDLEGIILVTNQRGAEIHGYASPAEMVGENAFDMALPSDRGTAIANLQRTLDSGRLPRVEYTVRRKDGTLCPIELSASLICDAQGHPEAFIGVTRDITDRKRAEQVLWQTKMVVEHSPVILYRLRAEGGWPFDFVSENVARAAGYTAEELLTGSVSFAALIHPDDRARVLSEMEECAESGVETFHREYRALLKSGAVVWVEDHMVIVRGPDGRVTHYQGVLLDVTENKRLEEQFRQAQKMETVGRLAGGIAHDFNNFLTAIRGYTGLVYDALRPEDPVRSDVEQVLKAAERAASMTGQLLAFSRRQILEPRPANLNDLVRETEKMVHRLLGEDIELVLNLAPDLALIRVDPGQITQAVVNLVVNARDAMPDGGVLTIETANVTLDQGDAGERAGVPAGQFVMLKVNDTGVGMSEEVQRHLFEPFFTTKEAGRGTGLGLATVYGIIKQHQGHILVASAAGQGTTVRVYLPQIQEKVTAAPRRGPAVAMPRGSETVLVVEDEPAVRALIVRVLRSLGYDVLEAVDGNEAIQVVRAREGKIQLLLTDVVMPQMDGRMLASLLHDVFEEIRVLYVSGYATDVLARYGVLDEGVAFLHKPFTAAVLANKVREVLDAEV